MGDIQERRLLQRTNLALYLKVINAEDNSQLGNIIDINVCGFLLLTKETFAPQTEFSVKIELPAEFEPDKFAVCKAKVRRADKSVNPSFNEAGFEITELSPEARDLIERLEQALLLKFGD